MLLLYRLSYTAFSLAIITAVMMPVILILRLLLLKAPRKYSVYLWILLFFRGICPVSMSSPLCIVSSWNRHFHMILSGLGLEIMGDLGVMTGWKSVFDNHIKANFSFTVCTIIWLIGILVISLFTFLRQKKSTAKLKEASNIYDRVYQINNLKTPLITGILRPKFYISSDMRVDDVKYLLHHYKAHVRRNDALVRFLAFIVVCVQWFNPFIWIAYNILITDIELAADDEVIKKNGLDISKQYAQELVNIKQHKSSNDGSFLTFDEKSTTSRSLRLIYMKKADRQYSIIAVLILFLCFVWGFLLRPLQILWNGGTWGVQNNNIADEDIFTDAKEIIVAETSTTSPEGLERILSLVMSKGTHNEEGYTGSFVLKLSDSYGAELAYASLDYIFSDIQDGEMHFENDIELNITDYNEDGVNEISIGQKVQLSEEKWEELTGTINRGDSKDRVYAAFIFNIYGTSIKKASDEIYTTDTLKYASPVFEVPEETKRVFNLELSGQNIYYVWDFESEKYIKKEMTEEELKKYKKDYDGVEAFEGEINRHTLLGKDGTDVIEVKTSRDNTGGEVIKSIILSPGDSPKNMMVIEGYYYNLQWATDVDVSNKRYAVLTYNGKKSQTFIIYDTKEKKTYYEHSDGNSILEGVFKKFNSNVEFDEDGFVAYSLLEKDENKLTIQFAADTSSGSIVSGSYVYNTSSKKVADLSYRHNNNNENSTTMQNNTNDADTEDINSIKREILEDFDAGENIWQNME